MMKVFFKLISYIIVFFMFPLYTVQKKGFTTIFELRNKSNKFHCTENKVKRCQTQSVYITVIKTSIKKIIFGILEKYIYIQEKMKEKFVFYIASKVYRSNIM